jgi:hypothetical protein
MYDNARGGNDILTGGSSYGGRLGNGILGDAVYMGDNAQGGDDILIGGSGSGGGFLTNELLGDAGYLSRNAQGGDDILIGGDDAFVNRLWGDANVFSWNAEGGDDILTGGSSGAGGAVHNELYGDGQVMIDSTQGGDDILIGGDKGGSGIVTNTLVGDASETYNTSGQSAQTQGGNDHLISGINATDHMWGDWQTGDGAGGSDTFVFKGAFGSDFVYDFAHAQGDLIEFQVGGVDSFDDLTIVQDGANTVITTSASEADTVTLVNYDSTISPLTASEFHFHDFIM